MLKVFKVSDIRALMDKVSNGEITYSRMVELMNEQAYTHYSKYVVNSDYVTLRRIQGDQFSIVSKNDFFKSGPVVISVTHNEILFERVSWDYEGKKWSPVAIAEHWRRLTFVSPLLFEGRFKIASVENNKLCVIYKNCSFYEVRN